MNSSPTFFAEVREALRKRGKAIKHQNPKVSIERVVERTDGAEWEKLEIECPYYGKTTRLTLHVWQDRWILVDARRSSKAGWVWEFRTEGRLLGGQSARALVGLFEASLGAGHWDTEAPAKLERIWSNILATGPKAVT